MERPGRSAMVGRGSAALAVELQVHTHIGGGVGDGFNEERSRPCQSL